jgi:hypothetical protein
MLFLGFRLQCVGQILKNMTAPVKKGWAKKKLGQHTEDEIQEKALKHETEMKLQVLKNGLKSNL